MPETLLVPVGITRSRADKMLAASFPEHSRAAWQRMLDGGHVTRNGTVLSKRDEVNAGDELVYEIPEVKSTDLTPADIPLDVLFEDEHLLVVNKAAGMVVHPGAGTKGGTLVHALLHHCAGSLSGIGGVERPGIVHRLDRETTGVIVVAKSDAAHRGLAEQFAERDLHKEYLAIVSGVPRLLSGVVEKPIARDKRHRHRMAIDEDGRSAKTVWTLEEKFPSVPASLFKCEILTGRTHQIRVHMKSIGHSLIGDRTYGWRSYEKDNFSAERVMLHAERLDFTHPITSEAMSLRAPPPADFQELLNLLRQQ
ncbi:MAG: RluA family pseudouridine synthase [Synoicihabitans sp.]